MNTYGFIGLGLIGGSLAKMIKENEKDARLICFSRNTKNILPAVDEGIIDTALPKIGAEFHECSIIFLCTPVLYLSDILKDLRAFLSPECIITDVGSVKGVVTEAAKKSELTKSFIGGHPMAGSEKTGYKNSYAGLLRGAKYILTPLPETPAGKLESLKLFLTDLGCDVYVTSSEKHDYMVAGISHLPHISAATLTEAIKKADTDGQMLKLAATGFRDTTRIAASSPEVWEQICLANSQNIIKLLDKYINELSDFRELLQKADGRAINELFRSAGEYLKKLDDK